MITGEQTYTRGCSYEFAKALALRDSFVSHSSKTQKESRAQYLTPESVARRAAGLFGVSQRPVRCLDLGAGTGVLSACLSESQKLASLDLVEVDESMLSACKHVFSESRFPVGFIAEDALSTDKLGLYERVVLNPPYKKMAASDERLERLPVKVPNLYAAFMSVAACHLAPQGEMVAIVPRSWTNGAYFKEFRRWILGRLSLEAMVVYESRSDIFSDSSVLQEVMLVKLANRGRQSPCVMVSTGERAGAETGSRSCRFGDLVNAGDDDMVVRVEPQETVVAQSVTLREAGFCASTGKVVDFRVRQSISLERDQGFDTPLIYACNLKDGRVLHPLAGSSKPQWCRTSEAAKLVVPPGRYVLVKRFSPKEEKRRIQAYALEAEVPTAIENHVNVIHSGTPRNVVPLCASDTDYLLMALNSQDADEAFRSYGGSTQVNASDLNRLPLPKAVGYA